MTESTHEYTAVVTGIPDLSLPIDGGEITLDEGAYPHVQASLGVGLPSGALLAALDPREKPRVRITAEAAFPSGEQIREFDLCVRTRPVPHSDSGDVSLTLASDEVLLEDFRALADNDGAFTFQSSLRGVVDYALNMAIPGATLEASPAVDADVTTYADGVNVVTNPCASIDLAGWGTLGLASFTRQTGATWAECFTQTAFRLWGSAGNPTSYAQWTFALDDRFAGKKWRFHARQRNGGGIASPGARAGAMSIYVSTNNGTSFTEHWTPGVTVANGQKDHDLVIDMPAQTNYVLFRLWHGFSNADSVFWSDVLATEYSGDPTDTSYWDGNSTDTAAYLFEWANVSGSSVSNRRALIDRPVDALLWPAGKSAMEFLHPIVQAVGFRLVCDEQRKWTLRDENYNAGGSTLTIAEGINLIDGEDVIDLDSGLWFDAQVTIYEWTDADGTRHRRVDEFALNDPPTLVNEVTVNAAYQGPGRSEYAVRRAQGRGREVTATLVADWTTKAEQTAQIILTGAPLQIGETSRVRFDMTNDRMTITTRTTDIQPGAIDLLPGTIDSLVGTIDSL